MRFVRRWICTKTSLIVALSLNFLACSKSASELQPSSVAGTNHFRTQVGSITVSRYPGDVIYLGSMLKKETTGCKFVDNIHPTESTPWAPIQAFWILNSKTKPTDPSVFKDVYFSGESLEVKSLSNNPQAKFRALTSFEKKQVVVDSVSVSPSGENLSFKIGFNTPVIRFNEKDEMRSHTTADGTASVVVSVAAVVDEKNECVSKLNFCVEGFSCPQAEEYTKTAIAINVELPKGLAFKPQAVDIQ